MASVYILHSDSLDKFYVGSCKDLELRLMQHQQKVYSDAFTAKASDWLEVLILRNLEYAQARNIESLIKSMKSSKYIKNLIKYPEMQESLLIKFEIKGLSR